MVASLWAQYKFERENISTLEYVWGFAAYLMGKDECYIQDIYIIPTARKSNKASELADEIALKAKENGCKVLTGTVDTSSAQATDSAKVLLAYGMKISHIKGNMIVFYKDLEE